MGMVKTDNDCNYCKLRILRQIAEAHGRFIRKRPAPDGGVNVYEVPDASRHYDLQPGTEDHDEYFKTWFPAVSDHCVC